MSKKAEQRERTRIALIEQAEILFGRFGVDGVSLRSIGQAIGSSNTNVVGYYFGTKESLIREIFNHREPGIDQRRAELMIEADKRGLGDDVYTLFHALWWPTFEQVDEQGRHTYSAFWQATVLSGRGQVRRDLNQRFGTSTELNNRIRAHVHLEGAMGEHRVRIAYLAAANSLSFIDENCADAELSVKAAMYEDALRVASLIITA